MERVLVQYSEELLAQIDAARGDTPRSAWIRRACENRLNGRIESVEGSPASMESTVEGVAYEAHGAIPLGPEQPSTTKKAKACAHSETRYKFGKPYCVKCGEFV